MIYLKPPPKSKCLGVFGLSANTTEDKIYDIFSKYGKIKRINVIFDTKVNWLQSIVFPRRTKNKLYANNLWIFPPNWFQTGRSRGFCFIYFKHLHDAKDAKESCSGMEIDHRRIRVDYSITQRPHEPTPGVYKGRPIFRSNRRQPANSLPPHHRRW